MDGNNAMFDEIPLSRRDLLTRCGTGFGMIGLAGVLRGGRRATPRRRSAGAEGAASSGQGEAHHSSVHERRPVAGRYVRSEAGARHLPGAAAREHRQLRTENKTGGLAPSPFKFPRCGQSGLPISEIYPNVARFADDLCVIRSMYTDIPNHEPSMFMMNSGHVQALRPSYGSWLLYGLGTENQNLPGYVVLAPGLPVNGAANWSNRFLPGIYQGCHINLPVDYDPRTVLPFLQNQHLSEPTPAPAARFHPAAQCAASRAARPGRLARRAHRFAGDGVPHADRRPGSVRPEPGIEPERASMYGLNGASRNVFANNCLLARRLVERGVRVVQIYSGAGQPWDTHGNNDAQHRQLAARHRPADRRRCCRI